MAHRSGIEWTETTWNPVTGCTKVSPGCKHCYAERMAHRLQAMGQPNYADGFTLTIQHQRIDLPLRWKKPRTIFVNSMSDLFHPEVPFQVIRAVFDVITKAHWHRFQVLTKRAERLVAYNDRLSWPANPDASPKTRDETNNPASSGAGSQGRFLEVWQRHIEKIEREPASAVLDWPSQ